MELGVQVEHGAEVHRQEYWTGDLTIFHMFKKVKQRLSMLSRDTEDKKRSILNF